MDQVTWGLREERRHIREKSYKEKNWVHIFEVFKKRFVV
jgi:hypothetical protein